MKWNLGHLLSGYFGRLFGSCFLLSILILSTSGCDFARAWNAQAFEADSSTILQGRDSKWFTLAYLKTNQPGMVVPYMKDRGEEEAKLNKRQEDISLDGSFLKLAGYGFSAWETGLGGIAFTLMTGLATMIMRRRGKDKIKEEIHKEELIEIGKIHYAGKAKPNGEDHV